jgi:putative zinc ribbon protein
MADRTLKCVDCNSDFIFSDRDQAFFQQKGFTDPKRCKPCRDIKKQSKVRQDQQRF